jgi:hypothetical protein
MSVVAEDRMERNGSNNRQGQNSIAQSIKLSTGKKDQNKRLLRLLSEAGY